MFPLVLVASLFVAGLVMQARRAGALGQAPHLVLGVLPLALLFVPVQLLTDVWQLLATFREIARAGAGSSETVLAVALEHQRAWSIASWAVAAALIVAGVVQALKTSFGAAPGPARATGSAGGWGDWARAVAPIMVLPCAIVAIWAQRAETRVLGLLTAGSGVEPPSHVAAWQLGYGPKQLGGVIGTE